MTGRCATRLSASLFALVLLSGPSLGQAKAVSPPPPRGSDQTFTLGGDGWVLERFGRNLAILRTGVIATSGAGGLLVLSCEGHERRWRLSLAQPISANAVPSTSAAIFVRPAGAPGRLDLAMVGRVQIANGRVLTLAENRSSGDGFVPAFVRLLKAGPERFDLLMRTDGPALRHRLFGTAVPVIVFAPVVRRTDLIAFDDFLATCLAAPE